MECVFCKIINGDFSSYKIYEDDKIYIDVDGNDVILDVYLNFHGCVQRICTQN